MYQERARCVGSGMEGEESLTSVCHHDRKTIYKNEMHMYKNVVDIVVTLIQEKNSLTNHSSI